MEYGMKPFVIGLLAPVVYADFDGSVENVYLVTSIQGGAEHRSGCGLDLELEITIQKPGSEPITETRVSHVPKNDQDELAEDWKVWCPMTLVVPGCVSGTRVSAQVSCVGASAWASLLYMQSSDEEGSEANE